MRVATVLALLLAVLAPRSARAWDAAWAVRPDGDVSRRLDLAFGAALPLAASPAELHVIEAAAWGEVVYVDDDKAATLVVAAAGIDAAWREQRGRYDASAIPSLALLDLEVELRLSRRLHVLYGAGLLRTGPRTHALGAGLAFHLGLALPLLSSGGTMREHRRGALAIETRPLVASLVTFRDLEGLAATDLPVVGAAFEVALAGRLERWGCELEGDLRLSGSYTEGTVHLAATARWRGPTFWSRLAPLVLLELAWPARPLRRHVSEPAARVLYEPHLRAAVGLSVLL